MPAQRNSGNPSRPGLVPNSGPGARPSAGDSTSSIAALLSWRPLQVLLGLLAVAPLVVPRLHFGRLAGVGGTVEISAAGASGEVADGRYHIALPISVANSTDSPIYDLSLRVTAYACPAAGSRLADCRKLVDTGHVVLMAVPPGGSGQFSSQIDGLVPAGTPNGTLRVTSLLEAVHDGVDRKREAEAQEPVPSLPASVNSPENSLQDKVDRSTMPS